MKLGLNANAVITNAEGKFLFIKLKGGPFKGGLCIPGGRIEPGELAADAACREVMEETGIVLTEKPTPFGFCEMMQQKSQNHRVGILLHCTAEGTPQETEEGIAQWLTYEEAEPDLIAFTKKAIDMWHNDHFHFTLLE